MEEIIYKVAEKKDIPQMISLMNSQYNRKKDEKYFLWQYFNSVYPSVSICAFSNNSIIGMFGIQKRILTNNLKIGNTLDAIVKPEFRGKRLFSNLYEKVTTYFDDLDILCALANLNGKNVFVGLGWEMIGNINKIELTKLNNESIKFDTTTHVSYAPKSIHNLVSFTSNKSIRNWRFDKHPDYHYEYVAIDENNFAIIKIFIDPVTGLKYGDIVDFYCRDDNFDNLKDLFVKAISELKKQNIESITTWALPHTQLYHALISLGLKSVQQDRYFCLKILNKNHNNLYDVSNWHIVQADTEVF